MLPAFHIHGAIRVEYRVRTRPLQQGTDAIESEQQLAGGTGALCALALARLGARVRLSGNALGDDSHGRFLRSQFQAANIETDAQLHAGVITPYAILLRTEDGQTQTLLSPQAQELVLPPVQIQRDARTFDFSLQMKSLEWEGKHQGYDALLDALRSVLNRWLKIARPNELSEHEAQLTRWLKQYDQGFRAFPF